MCLVCELQSRVYVYMYICVLMSVCIYACMCVLSAGMLSCVLVVFERVASDIGILSASNACTHPETLMYVID